MVGPKAAIDSVRNAIQQDGTYLAEVRDQDIITHEPDLDAEDTAMQSPFVAIYPIDVIRSSPHDTDFVGFVEDQGGNHIGKRFEAIFNTALQIDIYVAGGDSNNDPTELGHELWQLLRPYDDKNTDKPLPDDDGNPLSGISRFRVGDGERADDLTFSPNARRWRHESLLRFRDIVENTSDFVTINTVHTPTQDDMTSGDYEIEYTYTQS